MNRTIRHLDEQAYRALRARAVLEKRPIGEVVSEAIRDYLARGPGHPTAVSLRALEPEPYPEGNERLSSEIDVVVYGPRR